MEGEGLPHVKMSVRQEPRKVTVIGSGNWGMAIGRIVALNAKLKPFFHDTVRMWVYEEEIDGRKLTEIINTEHENVKYLPGYHLPHNLVADPDIESAAHGADILVFVVPHQFIHGLCSKIKDHIAPDCICVSLIKGLHFDETGLVLISDIISKELGKDTSVLMGANIANEVAAGCFCETTVGYNIEANGLLLKEVFDCTLFRVGLADNVAGVEICGALKNIVALGAGFSDGMRLGENCKAAVIRIGLEEMRKFIQSRYPAISDSTFFQSCGVADLITTAYGGRNYRVAKAFVEAMGHKTFDELEEELLEGQILQGPLTCKEIHTILEREGLLKEFPLFTVIYQIAFEGITPEMLVAVIGHFNLEDGTFSLPLEPGERNISKRLPWKFEQKPHFGRPVCIVYQH